MGKIKQLSTISSNCIIKFYEGRLLKKFANEEDPMEVLGCARGHTHAELIQNLPRHKNFSKK